MSDDATGEINMQDMILDILRTIKDDVADMRERLEILEERQEKLEDKINKLTVDVNIINKFQRSFAKRLSTVEQFCVERPLVSEKVVSNKGGNNGG